MLSTEPEVSRVLFTLSAPEGRWGMLDVCVRHFQSYVWQLDTHRRVFPALLTWQQVGVGQCVKRGQILIIHIVKDLSQGG